MSNEMIDMVEKLEISDMKDPYAHFNLAIRDQTNHCWMMLSSSKMKVMNREAL
jgi:hypothetical protein